MKEQIPLTRILIILFIVLSAVSARAQTPLRPVLPPRQAETRTDPPPAQSIDQTEANEDSHLDDSAGQTEESEDFDSEDSADQMEVSEDSTPAHSDEQTEVIEDSFPAHTAEQSETSDDPTLSPSVEKARFFIAPLAEIIGYSQENVSFGAGFALGAGNGIAIGARFLYAVDPESIHTMEVAGFMRFYLRGAQSCTGLFIQLNTGVSIYNHEHGVSLPAQVSSLSAGIAAGWRFLMGQRSYMEYYGRVGYPYIAGAGLAFAYRL